MLDRRLHASWSIRANKFIEKTILGSDPHLNLNTIITGHINMKYTRGFRLMLRMCQLADAMAMRQRHERRTDFWFFANETK